MNLSIEIYNNFSYYFNNMKVNFIKHNVGAHTDFNGFIYKTLEKSLSHGMYCTQFFMGNPKSCKRTIISDDDIDKSKKILEKFPIRVFSHFPYIANLCGSVKNLAWQDNQESKNDDIKLRVVLDSLEYELEILSRLNGGVVIHPGTYPDRKEGLATISKSINKINFSENSKLLLENSAGQGSSLATTFEEIKYIIDGIDIDKRKNIGVCIDTCHIYAYGTYDLSKKSEVDKMFCDFDKIIGKEYLTLIHLNDSICEKGSRKDRHACIAQGEIWKKDDSSLFYLLEQASDREIPCVLETEISDMKYFYQ